MKEAQHKLNAMHEDNPVFPHIFNPDDINPNKHMSHEEHMTMHPSKMHEMNTMPKHANHRPRQLQQRHQ